MKYLFISQEITPYVPDSILSTSGLEITKDIIDESPMARVFLPKWGIINERRNQLHEVIRLSGMNIIINDTDHPLLIKVATHPKIKMQVYFIDNDDFFKKRQMTYTLEGKEYDDNYEKMIFYARSVIETTKLLRWAPDLIQCQGWISILAPFYIKTAYSNEPNFNSSKCVLMLHNLELKTPLPKDIKAMLEYRTINTELIDSYNLPLETYEDLLKFSLKFFDGVVCAESGISPEIIKYIKEQKIPLLKHSKTNFTAKIKEFYESIVAK